MGWYLNKAPLERNSPKYAETRNESYPQPRLNRCGFGSRQVGSLIAKRITVNKKEADTFVCFGLKLRESTYWRAHEKRDTIKIFICVSQERRIGPCTSLVAVMNTICVHDDEVSSAYDDT